jgi:hypothetical protein
MDGHEQRTALKQTSNFARTTAAKSGTVASMAEGGRLHMEGASESFTPLRRQTGQKATGGQPANRQHRASHP